VKKPVKKVVPPGSRDVLCTVLPVAVRPVREAVPFAFAVRLVTWVSAAAGAAATARSMRMSGHAFIMDRGVAGAGPCRMP
jgi:hypothetical protein